MLHAPESQQLTDHFGSEIEDLRTIARLHGLPIGTPERLHALPLRLAQDVRLRSDLTELVRSLQQRDPDLGVNEVLFLVMLAIGGTPSLERRRDMDEVVDLTGGFLASVGGWPGSDVEPILDLDNPPDHDPRLDRAASADRVQGDTNALSHTPPPAEAQMSGPVADLRSLPEPRETVHLSEPDLPEASALPETSTAAESATLAAITHALARLERGNLELRLHLDSIDQRMGRMEPLLETAPPSILADEPPLQPEPPAAPRRAAAPDATDLAPRGPVVSEYELLHQRQEEMKAQRRVSLSSNFADPVPEPFRAPTSVIPQQQQSASALAQTPAFGQISTPSHEPARRELREQSQPSASAGDPVSIPRAQPPRRDRFAAAREIPGNSADFDPLYTATDEELAGAAPASAPQPVPSPLPADPVSEESSESLPSPPQSSETLTSTTVPSTPTIPTPDEIFHEPEPLPLYEVTRAPDRPVYQSLDPVAEPVVLRPQAAPQAISAAVPPAPRRTGLWAGGIAAAAVLGAAGFLYVNGLPSAITAWASGSTTVASAAHPAAPATPTPMPTQNTSAKTLAPTRPSAAATHPHTPAPGRVLDARASYTPSVSIENTSSPTFVPGGIMDGYLVSAPRPQYPPLANLAGVQGKISFEAMISKAGEVEALKVLGGPQLLRSAATDAVKQWQYRPFEVKGHPVEVRTIIRVDVASHASAPAEQ